MKISVPNKDDLSTEIVVSGKQEDVDTVRGEIEKLLGIKTGQPHQSWRLDIAQSNYSVCLQYILEYEINFEK